MKLTDANLEAKKLAVGNYGFSATKISALGASEYTLVTIVQDVSLSVGGFKTEMETCLAEVLAACRFSERCDNLLVRFITFNSTVKEVHGFQPLADCIPYTLDCTGTTALFDAAENAVRAEAAYGRDLIANDFSANGIVAIITDGDDNASTFRAKAVAAAISEAEGKEVLESLLTILVGVNVTLPDISAKLASFKDEAGLSQYVELKDASSKTLAKLARFISKSISSQSKALGTGAVSAPLTL